MKDDLTLFLKETKYCNFNDKRIKQLAFEMTKNIDKDKDKAVTLFYYVRDNILYRVGHWNKKATETLVEKKGVCTSKSNLLVALLRSINIPSGYGVMKVKGDEYFGPIVPDFLRDKISKKSVHIYTCVYLNNKWIKCDPSDDKRLSVSTSHINPQSKLINWDGESDAMLNLTPEHILEDNSPLPNIDYLISKKSRNSNYFVVKAGNLYIDFLRDNNKLSDLEQTIFLFKSWLKRKHTVFYFFFLIFLFLIKIKKSFLSHS